MNKKIKLESGNELQMTMLSFAEAMVMYRIVAEEVKKINLLEESKLVEVITSITLSLTISEKLAECVQSAFGRCQYGNRKIEMEMFENAEMREEYFEICKEIILYNVTPFLPKKVLKYIEEINPKPKVYQK